MGSSPLLPGMLANVHSGSGLPETPSLQLSQDLFVFSLLQFLTGIRCYPFSRELLARSPNSLAYLVPSCLGNTW